MLRNTHLIAIVCLMVLAASGFVGCASGSLRVVSTPPQADVYVAYDDGPANKIGQTPLSLDDRAIDFKRGKYINLTIKKDGYLSDSMIVPSSMLPSALDISSRLEETKLPNICSNQSASVERIARGIASAQSLMNRNNVEEARGKLSGLINEFPDVSVLHDLMGNVHYVSKNLDGALSSYQRSLNIDPTNSDTQRMVTKLRQILNREAAKPGGQ